MGMEQRLQALTESLERLLPREGQLTGLMPGLSMFRIDRSFGRVPYSYESEILIMAQGQKRAWIGARAIDYDWSRYLVLPVPLPLECEGYAPPGKPILGFSMAIDPLEVGELVLQLGRTGPKDGPLPRGIFGAGMTEQIADAAHRLVKALEDPLDRKVLAPLVKREILFRVLENENGELLQALALRNRRFHQISKVLRRIHHSYRQHFEIEDLAREADMSGTTFYQCFKAVTDSSPLQYIKRVKLHKARSAMLHEGVNASLAAEHVGYESVSQFNREYKRLFGVTPGKDYGANRTAAQTAARN